MPEAAVAQTPSKAPPHGAMASHPTRQQLQVVGQAAQTFSGEPVSASCPLASETEVATSALFQRSVPGTRDERPPWRGASHNSASGPGGSRDSAGKAAEGFVIAVTLAAVSKRRR